MLSDLYKKVRPSAFAVSKKVSLKFPKAPPPRALLSKNLPPALHLSLTPHLGTLDLERLITLFPDARSGAGRALSRAVRTKGRYVLLSRPLGPMPEAWQPQKAWQHLPALQVNRSALLLPWSDGSNSGGAVLLAEHLGHVYQFVQPQQRVGSWKPLGRAAEVQTSPDASIDAAVLGLNLLPENWRNFTSLRQTRKVSRLNLWIFLGIMLVIITCPVLIAFTGQPLWALGILCVFLIAFWGQRLANQTENDRNRLLFITEEPSSVEIGLKCTLSLAMREQLLPPGTLAALVNLRAGLTAAWARFGPEFTEPLYAELDARLEARFAWMQQDEMLDVLLEHQIEALASELQGKLSETPPEGPKSLHPATLLSPDAASTLGSLQALLAQAVTECGRDFVATVQAELDARLIERYTYAHPDAALDALLGTHLHTLLARLREQLALEQARTRHLAAQQLEREQPDPHF